MRPTKEALTSLDQPLVLGPGLELQNHLILASLTRNRSGPEDGGEEKNDGSQKDAVPNRFNKEYYVQRARGGFGLLLSEGTLISPQGTEWPNAAGIWSDEQIEKWKEITDAVHEEKGIIFCQLWHVGRMSHPDMKQQKAAGGPVLAPSAIAARGGKFRLLPGEPGNVAAPAMADPKIAVELFRKAAENAKKAGFDGVEFHCANGYLPNQFLDRYANTRTDAYGGSVRHRVRFPIECLEAICTVWSPDKVGIKVNPTGGYNDVGMNEVETVDTYTHLLEAVGRLKLGYVQFVRYVAGMDPEFDTPGPEKKDHKRSLCHGLDIEKKLAHPFIEAQKKDGRKRLTKIFYNGGFGGKDIAGGEASEWIATGRADGIVYGSDSITNPDLPFRIFHTIPLTKPGGGEPKTWYNPPQGKSKGEGYVTDGFCDEFLAQAKGKKEGK